MGQYHTICAMVGDNEYETVRHYPLGSGAKCLEQIAFDRMVAFPSAIAYLLADGLGDGEADLPSSLRGRWSGKPIAFVGDYAEPMDLVRVGKDKVCGADGIFPPELYEMDCPDLSESVIPILERANGIRFIGEKDRWADYVRVHINNTNEYGWKIPEEYMRDADYYKRNYGNEWIDLCQRDPAKPTPSFDIRFRDDIACADVEKGDPLVFVNLDRKEYFQPSAAGDRDDLLSVLNGSSPSLLCAMLYHHDSRGGGDANPDIYQGFFGRWRGCRIALVSDGETSFGESRLKSRIAQDSSWRDISGVIRFHRLSLNGNIPSVVDDDIELRAVETMGEAWPLEEISRDCRRIMSAALQELRLARMPEGDILHDPEISIEISLPVKATVIDVNSEEEETVRIPAMADFYLGEGRILFSETFNARVNVMLDDLEKRLEKSGLPRIIARKSSDLYDLKVAVSSGSANPSPFMILDSAHLSESAKLALRGKIPE